MARDHPVKYFEDEVPPLNIGMIHAGNWPANVPTEAFTQMVYGVFPAQTTTSTPSSASASKTSWPPIRILPVITRLSSPSTSWPV
ncbi:MAG: hypothetical protein ACLUI3_08240 [Christensenellales bacterium]